MTERVIELKNRNDLKKFVLSNNYVVVKVSATWCGPCKKASPIFNNGFLSLNDSTKLVLVDADDGSDICNSLRVKSVPMYLFYKNGDCLEICNSAREKEIEYFFNQIRNHLRG